MDPFNFSDNHQFLTILKIVTIATSQNVFQHEKLLEGIYCIIKLYLVVGF